MKKFLSYGVLALVCLLVACGSGSSSVDPTVLTGAFGSADADQQAQVSSIVSAVQGNDFAGALAPLNAVVSKGKLSAEQRDALSTVITEMQRVVSENQDSYTMEVYTGLSDLVGKLHEFGTIRR